MPSGDERVRNSIAYKDWRGYVVDGVVRSLNLVDITTFGNATRRFLHPKTGRIAEIDDSEVLRTSSEQVAALLIKRLLEEEWSGADEDYPTITDLPWRS